MMKIFFSTIVGLLLTCSVAVAGDELMECAGDLAIDAIPIYSVEAVYDLVLTVDEECDKEVSYAVFDAELDPEDAMDRFSIITGHLSSVYAVLLSFVMEECDCTNKGYDRVSI